MAPYLKDNLEKHVRSWRLQREPPQSVHLCSQTGAIHEDRPTMQTVTQARCVGATTTGADNRLRATDYAVSLATTGIYIDLVERGGIS